MGKKDSSSDMDRLFKGGEGYTMDTDSGDLRLRLPSLNDGAATLSLGCLNRILKAFCALPNRVIRSLPTCLELPLLGSSLEEEGLFPR